MGPDWFQACRVGSRTVAALMDDALRCPCDQDDMPLCVRCECLFLLAVAATDFAYRRAAPSGAPQEEPHA